MIESRTRGHRTEAWGYAGEELINIFGFATKIGITRPDIRETVYRVSLTLSAEIKVVHDSDSASIQEPFGISVRRPFGRSSRCCGLPPPEALQRRL